jgi:hypothetical protein
MDPLRVFCRQVRERSREHAEAIRLISHASLYSVGTGILRQELDSMVRVMYLLSLDDRTQRHQLIRSSVDGKQWRHPNGTRITDREMVDLANTLTGWAGSVYKFGCSFIHLSKFHDRLARDPFRALPRSEQRHVIAHIEHYHGSIGKASPTTEDIVRYVPRIFEKIRGNLMVYLQQLERGESLGES